MTQPSTLGGRIRLLRTQRMMSLQQLAGEANLSASYVSLIERGLRSVDRRPTIEKLAMALGVDPADLIGQPIRWQDPAIADAQASIPAVRLAVVGGSLDHSPVSERPLAETVAITDQLVADRSNADFVAMADALPSLVTALYGLVAHGGGDDRASALRHLIRALNSAMTLAHALGYADLAYMVTERSHQAAAALGSPAWQAVAAFSQVHALLPMGARQEAWLVADRATDAARTVSDNVGDQPGLAAYGSLLLVSAMVAAGDGKSADADARLEEATEVAARIGECGPDVSMFGPTNVALYKMASALERGEHDRAATYAEQVDPERVPNAERRAKYFIDRGRALAAVRGREDQAVAAFVSGERTAAVRVRTNVYAREAVVNLLPRVRPRSAAGRALRGVVYRMGIDTAAV